MALPLAPGRRLQRAFAGRAGALQPLARRALLIAAAYAGADMPVIGAACQRAGTDAEHLGEAEASGLVRIEAGRLGVTHPLIRGLVYSEAGAAGRRVAHAALAAALGYGDDRGVWHRAAATIRADEDVAASLERVGGQAVARRAYAAGSEALERAARLTPDADAAGRRLISAGQAAAGAGMADRALALLAEAAEMSGAGDQGARAQQLRGRMLVWRGRAAEAVPLLVRQAGQAEARLPALAAVMYSDACNGATTAGAYLEAERLARRAAGLLRDEARGSPGPDPAVHGAVLAMLCWALCLRGKAPETRLVLGEAARLAAARQGRAADARRVLTGLERQAASTASPVAGAAAARCCGIIDDDYDPAFARAPALDARRPVPFERAQLVAALAGQPETAKTR